MKCCSPIDKQNILPLNFIDVYIYIEIFSFFFYIFDGQSIFIAFHFALRSKCTRVYWQTKNKYCIKTKQLFSSSVCVFRELSVRFEIKETPFNILFKWRIKTYCCIVIIIIMTDLIDATQTIGQCIHPFFIP